MDGVTGTEYSDKKKEKQYLFLVSTDRKFLQFVSAYDDPGNQTVFLGFIGAHPVVPIGL